MSKIFISFVKETVNTTAPNQPLKDGCAYLYYLLYQQVVAPCVEPFAGVESGNYKGVFGKSVHIYS